jgi:hypothetical protein
MDERVVQIVACLRMLTLNAVSSCSQPIAQGVPAHSSDQGGAAQQATARKARAREGCKCV